MRNLLFLAPLLGILASNQSTCSSGGDDDDGTVPSPTPVITPVPTPYPDDLGLACDVTFPALPAAPTASRTFQALPTANGYVSATYAIDQYQVPVTYTSGSTGKTDYHHRLMTFTEHVMAEPKPGRTTRDLLYDLYLGVRVNGAGTWLSDVAEQSADYLPGTGIIHLVQKVGNLEIETFEFAPFSGDTYSLAVLGKVTNKGSSAASVDLYSLMNFQAGGEGHADGESVVAAGTAGIVESRGADRLYYRALEAPSHKSAGPAGDAANPYGLLTSGKNLSDQLVSGNDVADGFQWTANGGSLPAGGEAWGGFVVGFNGAGESQSALTARVDAFVANRTSSQLLAAEQAFWSSYHGLEPVVAGITTDEAAVYRQSTAVLKMAQVREPGTGYGQLLASLPPGGWNISWPRDAAYAIVALAHSGHTTEARDALQFMINGNAGAYASMLGISDYLISACRYYGDGTEQSDGASCPNGSDAGLNLELDDFGLFLWAWDEYLTASGDAAFQSATQSAVLAGVADPLVSLIDPAFDLLVKDSSIWERHWNDCFPNGRKHFSFSSLQAVRGLRAAAARSGNAVYSDAAGRIRGGLLRTSGGPVFQESFGGQVCPVLASSPEEICTYCGPYDASVIDAVNQGVVRADSSLAKGTMRGMLSHLRMASGPGFKRGDDGTGSSNPYPWYDDQEWIMIDLRMATAMARMGGALGDATLTSGASTLLGWVTAQARANAGLIAELLSDGVYTADDDADHTNPGKDAGHEYQGSVPMVGFGPGVYILAVEAVHGG